MTFFALLLFFVITKINAAAFLIQGSSCPPLKKSLSSRGRHVVQHRNALSSALSALKNDNEEDQKSKEKSRMTDFVSQYLDKNKEDGDGDGDGDTLSLSEENYIDTSTHLVAIPMDSCHELLIELESVQRAILYHCPILVHACIVPAMTRLPLLYVQAKDRNSARVTRDLGQLVEEVVQKHIFKSAITSGNSEDEMDGANEDGIRPLTMTFSTLEIDGSNNNVLNTVGVANDEGTKKVQSFISDLKQAIEAKGWRTIFPPDPHNMDSIDFRPRLPFMSLPKDFDNNLNRFKDESTVISDEDFEYLSSDQGGNGISPIFWANWWDDVFGSSVRLSEVAIYPRRPPADLNSDDMFYLPYETILLPEGNAARQKAEARFRKYQDDRMEEELQRQQSGQQPTKTTSDPNDTPDIMMTKTRERLESLFQNSNVAEVADAEIESDATVSGGELTIPVETTGPTDEIDDEDYSEDLKTTSKTNSSDDPMDDWMKLRIKRAIESRAIVRSQDEVKKDKPAIEDNPVFQKFHEGTLVPKVQRQDAIAKQELPPYPSNEHFIGIWRVVTSPTGFPAEETASDKSENLILRVDGTTAGGPILDPETNQKAAGGTWKMLIDADGRVRLRIRLVIPPKKERILVMEGDVTRMDMTMNVPMASKAFGIPELEAKAKQSSEVMDAMVHCGGKVCIVRGKLSIRGMCFANILAFCAFLFQVFLEDAGPKKNREDIGTFSLMKLQLPNDPSQYTITIPKPVRNQD
jgi:hypothetical protein